MDDGTRESILREARRRETPPGFPAGCALLVVDMQRFFLEEPSHAFLPEGVALLPRLNAFIADFAAAGRPVFFSRHGHAVGGDAAAMGRWWGPSLLMEDDPLGELHPELEVPDGARIIAKETYDMFGGTELEDELRRLDVKRVVVTGVMSHLCVETTARSAFLRGFDVTLPVDGCASSRPELHESALRTLGDGFAALCTLDELSEALRG